MQNVIRLKVQSSLTIQLISFFGPAASLSFISLYANVDLIGVYSLAVFLAWLPFGLGVPDLLLQSSYDRFVLTLPRRNPVTRKLFFYKSLVSSNKVNDLVAIVLGLFLAIFLYGTNIIDGYSQLLS